MKTLEQRLFHLFPPADVAKARTITPASVACPRVGQVRATVVGDDGDEHEVQLELSAHRRGGMTLETHCTTSAGRAGRPCAILAAVLLEVDRRRLLSGIHDQTPVTLDIVAEDVPEVEAADDDAPDEADDGDQNDAAVAAVPTWTPPPAVRRGGQRLPAWATELEERRRLVEPAVRAHGLSIPDQRRAGGALVFLLDLGASSEARAAVLVPARMQLDVAGNATGRPRPVVLGPEEVELDQLESQERLIVEQLVGATVAGGHGLPDPVERRSIARIVVSPRSAATHLAMLCETGRLVVQPEPRRDPERVVPMTWDGGQPWEFAFVLEPDDDDLRPAKGRNDGDDDALPRPAKATLRGMLVRGSQRKNLGEPKAILRAGLVVFADRIARLKAIDDGDSGGISSGWLEQFERRGPIEVAGAQVDGLIERLALLADVPRLVLPAWTGWRIESGAPRPKLVLDDSPAVSLDAEPGERRRAQPRVHLAGRVWFDYAGLSIAADDPAGGAADATHRVFVRRDRTAEREALALLPRHGATAARGLSLDGSPAAHHVEIARNRLDTSVSQLAATGWLVKYTVN